MTSNRFAHLLLLVATLCFASCHTNTTTSAPPANAVTFSKPPEFIIGNITGNDTSRKVIPADSVVYEVIKAFMADRKSGKWRGVRYNCVAKVDSSVKSWIEGFVKQGVINDTVGLQQPDTALYIIDWQKINHQQCFTPKELIKGCKRYSDSTRSFEDFEKRKRRFIEDFQCFTIVSISYPKLNNAHNIAIIVQTERDATSNGGSEIYVLKKIDGKWKILVSDGISAT